MDITAQLNGIRMAPRKVRAVVRVVKRKNVDQALDQLEHMVKRPAPAVSKLILSALANAENTYRLVRDNLYVKDIVVNEGMKLKRYIPKGFGRPAPIHKRTSRIKVILAERVPGLKQAAAPKKEEPAQVAPTEAPSEKTMRQAAPGKPAVQREMGTKQGFLGKMKRRLFRRKSV